MNAEKLGRISLLKYCMMTVLIALITPLIVGLIFQLFLNDGSTALTFYTNLFQEFTDNYLLIIIQILFLSAYVWGAGTTLGRWIILGGKPKYLIGGLCFFGLWLVLFTGTTLTDAIINSTRWGTSGFKSAILGWLRYGLPLFIIYGVLHGLTMGYLLGNEVKNKGLKLKITTRQQML